MYGLAFTLAIVALIAAILGFGGLAGGLANVALVIFVLALIGTVVFFVLGWKSLRRATSVGSFIRKADIKRRKVKSLRQIAR